MATVQSFPAKWKAARKPLVFTFSNEQPYLLPFQIWAGLPGTHLNATDKPYVKVGEVDGNMGLDGLIRVNVSEYISAYSKQPRAGFPPLLPPTEGIDVNLFTSYFVRYGNAYLADAMPYEGQSRTDIGTSLGGTGASPDIGNYELNDEVYLLKAGSPAEEALGPYEVKGFLSGSNDLIISRPFISGTAFTNESGGVYTADQLAQLTANQYQDTPIRWALHAAEDPDFIDRTPTWVWDTTTIECEQEDPRSNSNRVAQMKDENPCSLTYLQYKDAGMYYFYDTNATECPITAPAAPNPQFAGTIRCIQPSPRTESTTEQTMQDMNPDSATYLQWLRDDNTYTTDEGQGDFFPTGNSDATLCPIGDMTVTLSARNLGGVKTIKINGFSYTGPSSDYEPTESFTYSALKTTNAIDEIVVRFLKNGVQIDGDVFAGAATGTFTFTGPGTYVIEFQGNTL